MPPALLAFFDRVGGPRRATILLIGLGAAFGVFGLAKWASAPTWVPAFAEVPIADVGPLTDRLTQAGVEFKLGSGGGTVLVKSDDVAKARVALARAGVLPTTQRPGMEIFDQPSWGQTDLTQQVNLRRGLEGELERTIGSMRGIKSAKVHLVLSASETYGVVPPPAEASVVLEPQGLDGISPEVVRGIARTVASSVEGLTSDHVTIVDDAGRTLSEGDEEGSVASLTSRQLSVQLEVEKNLRDKAERLLAPVLGAGNARVQVNATLNFDRVERSSQTVDPNRQAVNQEAKSEIIPTANSSGAASVSTSASYMQSVANESVSSAIGSLQRLSVAVLLATPAPSTAGAAGGASAPAIDVDSAALRSQVETLVKSAVGFNEARGDIVTVTMLPFTPKPVIPVALAPTTLEQLRTVQRPALSALGIVLAFIIAMLTLRAATKTSETVTALGTAGAPGGYLAGASAADQAAFAAQYQHQQQFGGAAGQLHADGHSAPHVAAVRQPPTIVLPTNPMREQVLASVDQQPEIAAKLMRAWLRDG